MEGGKNPYNGRVLSPRYYTLLRGREKLPVFAAKDKIQRLVARYQTLLLVGETGSGKTTQVPQFVLEMNPEHAIACTQPRRVAATSVSERVAEELDVTLGEEVGYTIRFDDMSSERTRLKYLTDGMLLREAMSDPLLRRYSVIILDEAHERTVHTDVLIGVVKELLPRRPELRVVVMSATLEERRFQVYFPEAPLVHIAGRMFGVEVYFSRSPESNYVEAAIRTATQIHLYEGEGDILIFLTGEDEIEQTVERLQKGICMAEHSSADCHKGPIVVLPLYSALPPQQQRKVFQKVPPGTRKIVVATNVAETSLTIDGVVFVVDSGFSKQKVFNPKLRVESLLVTPISQASARQRCGRAGRTKPGKCFRLYTTKAFDTLLQPQTYPEILRCNLGSVVLHMKMMGVEDLVNFDFVEPPAPETLMRALELLNYLGAINDDGDMTEIGRQMAEFPLEPEMAAMLLHSPEYGCSDDIARICAMLSVQSPFVIPTNDQRGRAMRCREQFSHPTGDHVAFLNAFNAFYDANNKSATWASENYLNPRVMRQAVSIYRQLLGVMRRLDRDVCSTYSRPPTRAPRETDVKDEFANEIRRAILRGYFTKVALSLPTKNQFMTLKDDVKCLLFPSTFLNRRPKFVVFNELVLTSNTYIRTVTAVADEWLLEASPTYFAREEFDGVSRQVFEELHRRHHRHAENRGGGSEKRPRTFGRTTTQSHRRGRRSPARLSFKTIRKKKKKKVHVFKVEGRRWGKRKHTHTHTK
ncbi:putative pre-mRNA splicing factor ATP-dependent RNA helicase [Trypanosoma cruzi]|uniref:RNA helicase n=1 Tax=Trypanosoma cruzi TaxID=5693 RepID=A0A2V2W112_TRYCR|nr:putative pre-mRNA splicing factor ATP-dependent RNA helicase [Trypanosoma cruzi]